MKHLFIINPAAGIKDRSRQYIEEIERVFADLDEPYEIALTEYPRHATEIARAHAAAGAPLRIYSVGGDGTLGEVLAGCYGYRNVELAAYPSGTGNDFIKVFPGLPFGDLAALVHGKSETIDILRYNDGVCINIVNCGFDANVAYNVRRFKKFMSGNLAYYVSLFYSFLQRITFRCRVELDGALFYEGRATLAVAANGRVYGGGFQAAHVPPDRRHVCRKVQGRPPRRAQPAAQDRARPAGADYFAQAVCHVCGRGDDDGEFLHCRGASRRAALHSARLGNTCRAGTPAAGAGRVRLRISTRKYGMTGEMRKF